MNTMLNMLVVMDITHLMAMDTMAIPDTMPFTVFTMTLVMEEETEMESLDLVKEALISRLI